MQDTSKNQTGIF